MNATPLEEFTMLYIANRYVILYTLFIYFSATIEQSLTGLIMYQMACNEQCSEELSN